MMHLTSIQTANNSLQIENATHLRFQQAINFICHHFASYFFFHSYVTNMISAVERTLSYKYSDDLIMLYFYMYRKKRNITFDIINKKTCKAGREKRMTQHVGMRR